jgi:hypothetical protein
MVRLALYSFFGCSLKIRMKQIECGCLKRPCSLGKRLHYVVVNVRSGLVSRGAAKRSCNRSLETVLRVIGSSEKVHVVDALATTGDEGRGSLR